MADSNTGSFTVGADEPSPQQMRTMQAGAQASAVLPMIQNETLNVVAGIQRRALTDLSAGRLTPDAALEAWRNIASAHKLLKAFETRIKVGNSLADTYADQMNL